jgi:hypothetical protein
MAHVPFQGGVPLFGNLGWRMQMRKNRTRRPLTYRPYAQ